MTGTLDGRVAIVSGGGRGIGLAIAQTLAQAGARVVIADSGTSVSGEGADPEVAQHAARAIGPNAIALASSIASPGAAQALVAQARERCGGLDILVNNAAILRDALVFKGTPRDWDAVLHTSLNSAYYLINAATPVMREQFKSGRPQPGGSYSWGRIVNIGSTAGLYGNFGQAAYGAAKAGLFALTRITAMEMQRSGVTANFVVPFAHTRVTEMIKPANPAQATYKERALKVDARYVADLVLALCAEGGNATTGQIIGVRGRELFLFAQPRPVLRLALEPQEWTPARLARALAEDFAPHLTDLSTDLEHFNTEPLV
jgi:NAD(P)-dependent dehydrogenase (short-subunit alcohol dehydrogenase family)